MAGEWRERPLGELTENFDAIRVPVKEADRRSGPYPYYGASGIVDHIDGFLFDGEFLLIAEDGENLRTRNTPVAFMARGKFWVNNHAHIVRGNDQADTRFLMYALSATDISGYLTGSTMPKLTQGNMNRIPVFAPQLTEQRAIAHILGTLDDKIELNRRMSETLEAMARAMFKSWFVDFEPVRAKAEGRDPGLPPALVALFPDHLVESEYGEIPEGWKVRPLEEIACLHRAALSPGKEPDRIFEHYSIPAYDNYQEPSLDHGEAIKSNKTVVPKGAVLLSKLNPEIRRVWLPKTASQYTQVASTEFLCFTAQPPAGRALLYGLFQSDPFRRDLGTMVTGTSNSHQRVSPSSLLGLPVCAGNAKIYEAFERHAWPMLERTISCREDSRTLAALRDALLPKLLSGKVRVEGAERFLAERGL